MKKYKIIRYFFVGGMAAVVDITLFAIFAKFLSYNYLVVAFFSFIIATLINYLISIRIVFVSGTRHGKKKEVSLVYLVSGVGLLLNLLILYILISLLGVEKISSKVIATGLVFFWNYYARKYFIF